MLREARNPIECAFGHLKAHWSTLTRKMDLKLENIPIVVMACFILENFCEWHNDTIDQEAARAQMECNCSEDNTHKNIPDPIYSCTTGEGKLVRKTLTSYVQINVPDNY